MNISQAYKLQPGTGLDVPPGILHAPGSLCTYEPQKELMRKHIGNPKMIVPGQ